MAKAIAKTVVSPRAHPLGGRAVKNNAVTLAPADSAHRLALRAPEASLAALSKALGLKLPTAPKTSAMNKAGDRVALWLGPDEWLVIDMAGKQPIADCAGVAALHSAVNVSHRNTAILVEGRGAEAALNSGCPQDLSLAVFPVGACSRTVLGKIEMVLWRSGPAAFRVECWRSFSAYAFDLLTEGAADAALVN